MILAGCFLLALCSLLLYMVKEAHTSRVICHHLSFTALPESFDKVKIFFISDIHRRRISGKIIDQVQGKADIVVIGGDLTEKGVPLQRVKENILKLKKLGPVFFVWGNNDYETDAGQLDALLLHLDVKILANSSMLLQSENGDKLFLIGVEDISKNREDLDQALSETEKEGFKIFVCHNPEMKRRLTAEHGIHLMLSGHTHGGQIRLLGFSLYEKGGLKKEQDRTILISNGYGTTGVPLRLGARAETHLISIEHHSQTEQV